MGQSFNDANPYCLRALSEVLTLPHVRKDNISKGAMQKIRWTDLIVLLFLESSLMLSLQITSSSAMKIALGPRAEWV